MTIQKSTTPQTTTQLVNANQPAHVAKVGFKVCSKCCESKPLTMEYWQKNKSAADGFDHRCKKCAQEYLKNYYKKNKANRQEYNKKNSNRIKNTAAKYYKKNRKQINIYNKEYTNTYNSGFVDRIKKYEEVSKDKTGLPYSIVLIAENRSPPKGEMLKIGLPQ